MEYELDSYERDLEDNFEKQISTKNRFKAIVTAAEAHLKRKRSITIRVQEDDIEAIKIKASKLGIPYQTYINMLIHVDATKL